MELNPVSLLRSPPPCTLLVAMISTEAISGVQLVWTRVEQRMSRLDYTFNVRYTSTEHQMTGSNVVCKVVVNLHQLSNRG